MMENPILQRRAVRKYALTPVAGPDIEKMVAAFEAAPCGMHQVEDMQATVVTDEALLKKPRQAVTPAMGHRYCS